MAGDNLAVRVKALRWFHSIDLGNGVVTPGDKSIETIQTEQRIFFDPIALKGATLLDIGAWNGAYSFEATRRGANVLATDHYVWTHDVWRGREGFDIAKEVLGLNVKTKVIDVPDISVGSVVVMTSSCSSACCIICPPLSRYSNRLPMLLASVSWSRLMLICSRSRGLHSHIIQARH